VSPRPALSASTRRLAPSTEPGVTEPRGLSFPEVFSHPITSALPLTRDLRLCRSAHRSSGSGWQPRGQGFESPWVHFRRSEAIPRRLDRDAEREGVGEPPLVTSDRAEEEVVGVLVELPDTGDFTLLQAARVQAAIVMLRRSGFDLVLLPVGAAAPIVRRSRRRRWRPERKDDR
jgi:hypothetical protein